MDVRAVNETHIREMQHCIGLDYERPKRGKYKAYRNYCCCCDALDKLQDEKRDASNERTTT